jgi:hypothetical protein
MKLPSPYGVVKRHLNFERTAEGEIIVMAPTYSDTGLSKSNLSAQVETWAG